MPKRKRPQPLTPSEQRDADAAAREARLTDEQRARLAAAREQAAAEYAHLFDENGHLIPRRLREERPPKDSLPNEAPRDDPRAPRPVSEDLEDLL